METIAVYWEPIIKTYGFQDSADLCLLDCIIQDWEKLGNALVFSEIEALRFASIQLIDNRMKFSCVVDREYKDPVHRLFEEQVQKNVSTEFRMTEPVGLVTFHGPHYGDRYGIASAVFDALDEKVNLHASAFSGAVVCLVMNPDDIPAAKTLLSTSFEIPEYDRKKRP